MFGRTERTRGLLHSLFYILRPEFCAFIPRTSAVAANECDSRATRLYARIAEAVPHRVDGVGIFVEFLNRVLARRTKHLLIGNGFLNDLDRHPYLTESTGRA
jgi:hypothetical protein